jgi:FtsH-binding integral membrane protein
MADVDITHGTAIPSTAVSGERIAAFLRAAYGWMCAGLAITAVTAWFVASSPSLLRTIARSGPLYLVLVIAQLGIVFVLSSRVQRLSASTASWLFIGYSMLTGVTLSFMMLVYTGETLTSTFVVAAGMFGAMALYGTVARRSLAGWGQFLFMGLIGVVLASIVGLFWQNDGFQFVISFIGVIVFTGLAAYDAQRLKSMALMTSAGETGSYAIVGALALYLDFVNLFLMLLRLQGGGRRR